MSKSKRELREQRRAAERAAVAAESRRRRIRNLLGAAGLAVVLVVAGIAISASGGAKAKPVAHSSAAKLVAGIPEQNGVLGDPKAPITVTEYLDLQCPICAEASKANLPAPDQQLRPHRQGQAAGAHAELHRPGLGHRRQGRRTAPSSRASCGRSWRRSTPRRARRTPATSPTTSSRRSPRPPAWTPSKAIDVRRRRRPPRPRSTRPTAPRRRSRSTRPRASP